MNDFTKEELQDIYDAVMDTDIAMFENLPSKIQTMIDNYCVHSESKANHDYSVEQCKKCGALFI